MEKEKIEIALNEYGRQLAKSIKEEYQENLGITDELLLNKLSQENFIVLTESSQISDILFPMGSPLVSSNMLSIDQVKDLGGFVVLKEKISKKEYIPNDGCIHFFMSHPSCVGKNSYDLLCFFTELLPYEIFRLLIRLDREFTHPNDPDLFNDLTESLIKKYAEDFTKKKKIPLAKTSTSTMLAIELLEKTPQEINKDKMVFQQDYNYMLQIYQIGTGQSLKRKYEEEFLKPKDLECLENFLKKYIKDKTEEQKIIEKCKELGTYSKIIMELTNELMSRYKEEEIELSTSLQELSHLFYKDVLYERKLEHPNGYFGIAFILGTTVLIGITLTYLLIR